MPVTSSRSVGEWGTVFGDPVVATAILDRPLHHSHVLTIRGDSYRLREKRRSGLLKAAGPLDQELAKEPRCRPAQAGPQAPPPPAAPHPPRGAPAPRPGPPR